MISQLAIIDYAAQRAGVEIERPEYAWLMVYCQDSDGWGIVRPGAANSMTESDFIAWVQSFLLPETYNPEWAVASMDWDEVIHCVKVEISEVSGDADVRVQLKGTEAEFWSRVDRFREVAGDES